MQKWVYIVESNCKDPSREDEYIRWYAHDHAPHHLRFQGFMAASFYQNTNPQKGEGKFIAVYRIESDNIEKTFADRRQQGAQRRAPDPMYEQLLQVVSLSLYQEVPCPP